MRKIIFAMIACLPLSAFAAAPATADNPFDHGASVEHQAKPHKTHHAVKHEAANDHSYGDSGYYTNVSGHSVHRPVHASSRPAGATAHCADGTWSFSEHRQGTCSHHGGVSEW